MTLSDWTAALYEELSEHPTGHGAPQVASEPRPDGHGCFRIDIGQYGVHVMPDGDEVILWLLNRTGKTSGPIWSEKMTPHNVASAAEAISSAVVAAPRSESFQSWPPTGRDIEAENAVNDLWENIWAKMCAIDAESLSRQGVAQNIQNIHDYIDELTGREENAPLAQYAPIFKHQATDIMRKWPASRQS